MRASGRNAGAEKKAVGYTFRSSNSWRLASSLLSLRRSIACGYNVDAPASSSTSTGSRDVTEHQYPITEALLAVASAARLVANGDTTAIPKLRRALDALDGACAAAAAEGF